MAWGEARAPEGDYGEKEKEEKSPSNVNHAESSFLNSLLALKGCSGSGDAQSPSLHTSGVLSDPREETHHHAQVGYYWHTEFCGILWPSWDIGQWTRPSKPQIKAHASRPLPHLPLKVSRLSVCRNWLTALLSGLFFLGEGEGRLWPQIGGRRAERQSSKA